MIASDEQVNTIRNGSEKPFPHFRDMAADLDAAYGAYGWLQGFADHWGTLNGYTHSGLEQLGRQFRDDGSIGPNYPDEFVIGILVMSGTASIGCVVPIFRHMGLNEKATVLEQWLGEYPFYRKFDA